MLRRGLELLRANGDSFETNQRLFAVDKAPASEFGRV